MPKKLNGNTFIAFVTGLAIVAFAFYQRQEGAVIVPTVAFYLAAAIICLLPVLYAVIRHKTCRKT
jgi:hypothetical protein